MSSAFVANPTAPAFAKSTSPSNFDGKRLRKAPVVRKTVDFSNSIITYLQNRPYHRDWRSFTALRPTADSVKQMLPAWVYLNRPASIFCTKFISTCVNKTKCPINDITWTPAGRRIISGNHMGQFTMWSGNKFNFETILQAHDHPIRKFLWKWDDEILISSDQSGVVKYWQMTLNNIKAFQAHEEAVRDMDFGPLWDKFITASDDSTLRLWDFARGVKEVAFEGHGWDVRSCSYHPYKALLLSGSKDSTARLWCPKSGELLRSFRTHKDSINTVKWHPDKDYIFVTGSGDGNIKVWDLRVYKEVSTLHAHDKEVTCTMFHPVHHNIFITGGGDGSVKYWQVGIQDCQAQIHNAHDSSLWATAFHPLGHILATGSNDYSVRFWSRNKPGDPMDDKWNAQSLPAETRELALRSLAVAATKAKPVGGILQDFDLNTYIQEEWDDEEPNSIPGMGPKKSGILKTPEKDLLARSPRPSKRRRFYENLTSPQQSNSRPAFIQSLIYSPDRRVTDRRRGNRTDIRRYRRGRGGTGVSRNQTRRRGLNRPLPQPGRFNRQRTPLPSAARETVLPQQMPQRPFIPSAQIVQVPVPQNVENLMGRGYNLMRGPLIPPPMGRRGYSGDRSMRPLAPIAQGGRHTLPPRGGRRPNIRGRSIGRGERGRGSEMGPPARNVGGGNWGSTVTASQVPSQQARRGWAAPSNAPPNSIGGWRPGFPGRGGGQ